MAPIRPRLEPEELAREAGRVRRLARELVFDAGLAPDVEQEALLAALERPPRDPGALAGWLRVTVRNLARRAWLSSERRAARERACARAEGSVPSPAEVLEREEERAKLVRELLALDEPFRSALVLRYLEELPPREVARRLGVPLDTARTRIQRGLELLRARLERLDRDASRERGTWCLALVHALGVEANPARLLAHLAGPVLGGVFSGGIAMSIGKGLGVAAVAVVLVLALRATRGVRGSGDETSPAEVGRVESSTDIEPARAPEAGRVEPLAQEHLGTNPPPEEALPPPHRGTLVLFTSWSDGTPAAGIAADVHSSGDEDWYADARAVRTDSAGRCSVVLPAGRVSIFLDRGGAGSSTLAADETAELRLTLVDGMDVAGQVIDPRGRGVSGADVFLATNGPVADGHVVATTGADGRFELRALSDGLGWLSARAAGFGPSDQAVVSGSADSHVELVLELADGGGIEGRVSGPEGAVAEAWIQVGPEISTKRAPRDDGRQGHVPVGQRVPADAEGRFVVAGVAAGIHPVIVRAPGFAPWRGSAEVFLGRIAFLEVALVEGTTVAGVVRDFAGRAVADAEIVQDDGAFGDRQTRSGSDGAFRLRGLPDGEFRLKAERDGVGRSTAVLSGASGAWLSWSPVLHGLELRGRVVAPGRDPAGLVAVATAIVGNRHEGTAFDEVDGHGEFVLEGLADLEYTLELHSPSGGIFPLAKLERVRPDGEERILEVDPARWPSVHLRGRVLDAAGRPAIGVPLSPWLAGSTNAPILHTDAEGRFELGPYPSGRWRIRIDAPSGKIESPEVELGPDESWDFGDITGGS